MAWDFSTDPERAVAEVPLPKPSMPRDVGQSPEAPTARTRQRIDPDGLVGHLSPCGDGESPIHAVEPADMVAMAASKRVGVDLSSRPRGGNGVHATAERRVGGS
jgi:hypothetical protein